MVILKQDTPDRDLYSGLIRLHILHHAAEEPIFGLGMAEELARHGYKLSLGTLYPLLHGLERRGYLKSTSHRSGKTAQRVLSRHAGGTQGARSAQKQSSRALRRAH
jgi:hypothetical protein